MYQVKVTKDEEAKTFGYEIHRIGRIVAKGLGYATREDAIQSGQDEVWNQKDIDKATL